jgi:MFS family permease
VSFDEQSPQPSAARDGNVVSFVAMALGALSVAIGPIFGPLAIGFALYARRRRERLAGKALIVAIVGFAIGLAIAIAVISSRH